MDLEKLKQDIEAYKQSEKKASEIIAELKAENDRLREEVETRDNLVEHFRKEAINWAKISNDCIKDIEKYKQTLQEIKAIAESPRECILSEVSCCNICERLDKISHIITKTEEE